MREIALEAARRAVVAQQGFAVRRRRARTDEVADAIGRLGCVQIDAVSAVDRSQRLVLAARRGRLPDDALNRLVSDGRVFEYWAHEACLIPVADYPYFRALMRDDTHHRWWGPVFEEHPEIVERVLATVDERGPVSARDFGGAGTGFWGWSPPKRVLEALWTTGRLAVAHRRGVERRFDLPERVLPDWALGAPEPTQDERLRHFARRTVAARGLVREARIGDYYRLVRGRQAGLGEAIDGLVADGELERVRLRETGDVALVAAAAAERIADGGDAPRAAVLLSPFDNMLWDRVEARALFGFDHALEIYKPAPQRRWGYYVLPLLDGAELVGRVDAKADRGAGILRALATHWERRARPRALREAMTRLAFTLGLPRWEAV